MPKAGVNGINLYYEVHGQGEPLVMTQGYGGKHDSWFFQTRAFQKHYRVIVFDNRGIGKSDDAGEAYIVRTMASDAGDDGDGRQDRVAPVPRRKYPA